MPIRKLGRRFWKDLTSPRLQVKDLKSVYLSIRAKLQDVGNITTSKDR